MWGALKKDFGEFVTTVATETTETLSKMDTGLEEGQSTPLIDLDTGIPIDNDDDDDDDDDDEEPTPAKRVVPPTEDEMKEFLMTCEAVFLDELVVEDAEKAAETEAARTFLEEFDLETKTEEISKLLEGHPDTLQATFSKLADQVEYALFWQRYFFRFSDKRLEETYLAYYAAAAAVKADVTAKSAVPATLSSVTSFFGGVVNRLVEENNLDDIDNDDEEIAGKDGNMVGAAANSAMNFLAGVGSGRPPFVLNTAVSDDDDDDDDDEKNGQDAAKVLDETDDEEELGWDDDDDDDEDEEEDDDDDDNDAADEADETVEFKDAEKEKLQEELQQAREERDMLHKTVEMQAAEITKLQTATQPEVVAGDDEKKQVQLLQMQLFEKDSEMAALRAQLDDLKQDKDESTNDRNVESEAMQVAEVGRLNGVIADLNGHLAEFQTKADQASSLQTELEQTKAENQQLQSQLLVLQQARQEVSPEKDKTMQALLDQKDAAIAGLEQQLVETQEGVQLSLEQQESKMKDELQRVLMQGQDAAAEAEELRKKLTSALAEVDKLQAVVADSETTVSQLRVELENYQDSLKSRDAEDSDSTGVKISSASVGEPLPVTVPTPTVTSLDTVGAGGGDGDDGWGDDW